MSPPQSEPPRNIVCFAKDWEEDPTSNHHVMIELAKTHRVLWLNSVATRTPNLASGRDLRKIVKKLQTLGRGPKRVRENLWVYTPLVLPFPHSELATRVNSLILRGTIRLLRARLRMGRFQLWTFLPNVSSYVGRLGESLAVYYCVDEWSMFSYIDDRMVEAEKRLCERADVVFAVCQGLVDRKRELSPHTHLSTHGVAHELFATALDEQTSVPDDLAALPRPVLGFYGTIQDWVDLELVAELAQRRPEWTIAIIGGVHVDISAVKGLPNVHFLGRKPHAELPGYCKGFDVGLIPYVLSERMQYVNPIKLREYLSAGLPVVSTAVPEVARYDRFCTVAADCRELERAVEKALREDSPALRRERSEAMQSETWAHKMAAVRQRIDEAYARRRG